MKSKEELKQIKEEVETLGKKLEELNEDELKEVTGGASFMWRCGNNDAVFKGNTAKVGGALSN